MKNRVDINDNELKLYGRKSTILEYAKYIAKKLYSAPQRNVSIVYDEYFESYHMLNQKKGRPKKVS